MYQKAHFSAKQKIVSQIQMNHILWRCSPYPNICVDEHMWIDSPRPKFMCVAWIKSIHANEIANEMKWNGEKTTILPFSIHIKEVFHSNVLRFWCVFFSSPRCFGQPIVKIETVAVSKSPFTYIQKSMQVFPFEHLSTLTTTIKKREEQQREQFQQQQKRREKFIGQIFSMVFFFFILFGCFAPVFCFTIGQTVCVCVWVGSVGKQINRFESRVSLSLSHWFFMVVRSVLHFLDYSNAFTADEKTTKNTNISAFNRVSAGNYCRMD